MQFSMETITPNKAKQYLESNLESQRNVSASHVNKLAQMMLVNEFDGLNGQTIKFNGKKGQEVLIDGQHRLLAAIQANRNLKIGVLRGCSKRAFETIDNAQTGRTIANYYEIAGKRYSKVAAQVARWVYRYDNFSRRVVGALDKTPGHITKWALKNHGEIPDSIDEIDVHLNGFQKAGLGTKAHLAFFYYMARGIDKLLAYKIVEYIGSNVGTPTKKMANAKQVLMELAKKNADGRLPGNLRLMSVLSVLITLWNAERGSCRIRTTAGFRRVARDVIGDKKNSGDTAMEVPEFA